MNERELLEAARRLPKSIEPPRDLWPGIEARLGRRPRRWYWIPLAAAAGLAAVLIGRGGGDTAWNVTWLAGAGAGTLRVGDWLETDDSSRARIAVGRIGKVDVKPGTRIRLVAARADDHRLALAHGAIYAQVAAPPRLFFIETPAGTAIDLGCAYTLDMDSLGNGRLHVTSGFVEFRWRGRRAIVPLGAVTLTRPAIGPGTPFVDDAPEALRRALAAFDFAEGGTAALRAALAAARPADALSVWHLLERADSAPRGLVYDRLVDLLPPPAGVSRDAILALEPRAMDRYWNAILGIHVRGMILEDERDIDPRNRTPARP